MEKKKQIIKKTISAVNSSLQKFKRGGWIRVERIPQLEKEVCETLSDFVEAVFNRECYNRIPEFRQAQELLGGHLFKCILDEPDEIKKRFLSATVILIDEKSIIDPDDNLINELRKVENYLGGREIKFNSVKVKIKFEIK